MLERGRIEDNKEYKFQEFLNLKCSLDRIIHRKVVHSLFLKYIK